MQKQALAPSHFRPVEEYWPAQVDEAWQEQMVLQYAHLSKYVASRLIHRFPSQVSLDDLISSGIIGLLDAIHKFDPGKNVSFKNYAEFRIKGAILDELRKLDWVPRSVRNKTNRLQKAYADLRKNLGRPPEAEEVAAALGLGMAKFYRLLDETKSVSLLELEGVKEALQVSDNLANGDGLEILQDETLRDPFLAVHYSQLREGLARSIDALPDKEKLLISLYYHEEMTMKEIARIMGYTESRISQLHAQALLRLRGSLQEYLYPEEKQDEAIPGAADFSEPLPLAEPGGASPRVKDRAPPPLSCPKAA